MGKIAVIATQVKSVCDFLQETVPQRLLNPVRAGLAREAEAWARSSAAAHCDTLQDKAFSRV